MVEYCSISKVRVITVSVLCCDGRAAGLCVVETTGGLGIV
jgi:hypothetical protein